MSQTQFITGKYLTGERRSLLNLLCPTALFLFTHWCCVLYMSPATTERGSPSRLPINFTDAFDHDKCVEDKAFCDKSVNYKSLWCADERIWLQVLLVDIQYSISYTLAKLIRHTFSLKQCGLFCGRNNNEFSTAYTWFIFGFRSWETKP